MRSGRGEKGMSARGIACVGIRKINGIGGGSAVGFTRRQPPEAVIATRGRTVRDETLAGQAGGRGGGQSSHRIEETENLLRKERPWTRGSRCIVTKGEKRRTMKSTLTAEGMKKVYQEGVAEHWRKHVGKSISAEKRALLESNTRGKLAQVQKKPQRQ